MSDKILQADSVYDPHDYANRRIRHNLLLLSLTGMVLLPVLNSLLFSYLYNYYVAGNTAVSEAAQTVFRYALSIASALIPYVAFGLLLWSLHTFGAKQSRALLLLSACSLLIPYLSHVLIVWLTASSYYLPAAWANLLRYPPDLLVLIVIALLPKLDSFLSRMPKHPTPRQLKRQAKRSQTDPLTRSQRRAAGIMLLIGLSTEIYYTVRFIYSLLYEYYDVMTTEEAVSMITGYLTQILAASVGYAIMILISRGLDRMLMPYLNGEDNF